MLKWLACDSLKFTNVVELFHHNKHSIESMSDRSFALLKSRILKSHGPKVNMILIIAPTVNRADKPNLNKPSVLNTCTRFSFPLVLLFLFVFFSVPNLLSVCATPRYLTANGLKVRRRRRTRAGRRVGGLRVSSGGPRLAGPYRCRRPDRPILVGIMLALRDARYPMRPFHAFQMEWSNGRLDWSDGYTRSMSVDVRERCRCFGNT